MGTSRVHFQSCPGTVGVDAGGPDKGLRTDASASNAIDVGRGPCCENCGREAADREIANNTLLCARCASRYRVVVVAHFIVSLVAFIGIALYLMPHLLASAAGNPLGRSGPILTGRELLAFYVSLVVGVLVHECSHAACAQRFGFTVSKIQLGSGPVIFRRKAGHMVVALHLVPFAGLTVWRPNTTTVTPAKRAAVAFAGPLSNLALAAVCWAARSSRPALAIPAACANLLLFIENVMPRPYGGTAGIPNDGWQILKNLTNSYWARTHARRLELVSRCGELMRAGSTAEVIEYLRSQISQDGGDYPDAEALLCTLLLSRRQSQANVNEGFRRSARLVCDQRAFPRLRATALNNRAYMLAVGGWPNLMAEAEWAARAALRCHPNNASMLGTQALVLVRRGRFDEAEPIAEKVVQHRLKAMASAQGTALVELAANLAANRCALALLYARTGRVGAARRELAEARSLDTTCELLPELEQVLAAAPHDAVPAALVGTPTDSREAAVSIKPPLREADIAINSQVGALGARTPQSLSTTQQKGRP